jgi:hypothetical protein
MESITSSKILASSAVDVRKHVMSGKYLSKHFNFNKNGYFG